MSVATRSIAISGPLPPPLMLKQYDDVVPGGAERVVRVATAAVGLLLES